MKPIDWKESIYSDGTAEYLSNPTPSLGDKVIVKLRIFKEAPVKRVFLRCNFNGEESVYNMRKTKDDDIFSYYSISIKVSQRYLNYHFIIATTEGIYYYNQLSVYPYPPTEDNDFVLLADFKAPKWVKKTIFYHIFPDRFYNGNTANDVLDNEYSVDGHSTQKKEWDEKPGHYNRTHCLDFYGGDLEGIKKKINYLKKLGINALYLNPIFEAPSHHKYDCIDYFKVDKHLGGDEALIELVKALHKENMRIMLDISVNHTGTGHKWFNKDGFFPKDTGAHNSPNAKERKYYFFETNDKYHCWAGVKSLVTLNYNSSELKDIIYRDKNSVLQYWLNEPFNIDGWRFDVAHTMARLGEHQLHHEVWPELRTALKSANDQCYIIGEHWRDNIQHLRGDEWDGAMNYFGFARPVRNFIGNMGFMLAVKGRVDLEGINHPNAKELADQFKQHMSRMPHQISLLQYNILDSHDVSRLHNYADISFESYRGAAIMLLTFPGIPSIYYGDEVGLAGHTKTVEGCRYTMEWNPEKQKEEFFTLYQTLCKIRKNKAVLQDGGFKILFADGHVISYARFTRKEAFIVIFSQEKEVRQIAIPVRIIGANQNSKFSEVFNRIQKLDYDNGYVNLKINPEEGLLFEVKL